MAEFIVAVDHITYYAVQAADEVTADASITEYETSHARRHA